MIDAYWLYGGPPSGRNVVRSLVEAWVISGHDDLFLRVRTADAERARAEFGASGVGIETTVLRPHTLSVLLAWGGVGPRTHSPRRTSLRSDGVVAP